MENSAPEQIVLGLALIGLGAIAGVMFTTQYLARRMAGQIKHMAIRHHQVINVLVNATADILRPYMNEQQFVTELSKLASSKYHLDLMMFTIPPKEQGTDVNKTGGPTQD